jgi:hypothetical protein
MMKIFLSVAILALASASNCTAGVHLFVPKTNGDLPEPRECVRQAFDHSRELVDTYGCSAQDVRVACNGLNHPNVFGCSDVTAAGCATCFNHKEAFENVCVWCKTDSMCHDVGSLQDPCSNDACISIAVKTKCTDHNVADCPSV